MSVTERTYEIADQAPAALSPDTPVAVEVRGLEKVFRVPQHRIDSFKERFVHPFQRPDYRELQALRDIDFEVHKGEFFGIVGRNGSGKSTLLKILASIYRADAGTIRMAGRLAPFIELGVGFNMDLSARENVILNGVMMGLTPREARRREDAVFEFAELEEFREQKLKNYSSGMSVRLAFSLMLQVDADILLIDEVLAVGDAAFQQKCVDVFHEMRDSDRTVILVTHDMQAVNAFCHRAMLLHDGELLHVGEPEDVGRRYLRLNFGGHDPHAVADPEHYAAVPDIHARIVEAHLHDEAGEVIDNVEQGDPIRFEAVIEARNDLVDPVFAFQCTNASGVVVFSVNERLRFIEGAPDRLDAGERVRLTGTIENPLVNGRYELACWITSHRTTGELAVQELSMLEFVVFGSAFKLGTVLVDSAIDANPVDGEWR